jgi:SUMO ligase MMS21 Smc5/6 complex component
MALTINSVKKQLRPFNISVTKTNWGDVKVNLKRGAEVTATYHDDLVDALHTGLALAEQDITTTH